MTSRSMLRQLAVLTLGAVAAAGASARTEIQNKGSDTLVNAAQSLAEQYGKVNPKVAVAVSGGGSGTGIAAMINGTVDIANSSRKMSEKEIKEAQAKGRQPIEHIIGYDALAIFVHKKFPADSITVTDLAKIYGRDGGASKWSDLGITIPGCKGEIVVVSRQNNSGTYAYFKEAVLGEKGKFRQGTLDMHGSKDVADLVEKTPCAIGYSGLAYVTDHMKALCVAPGSRQALCQADRADGLRRHLSDRPAAVHVHQRRADRRGEEVSGLDQERHRPVHHREGRLRAGQEGEVQVSH
jgi:phosphate transport system substrate-binding protein